jgi:hypothetical protein
MVRATRKIRFSKSADAFNVGARPRLERIALSKDNGLYLGPQPKFETLYSDLVPVRAFPQKLFTSSTACESRKAVFQKFPRSGERIPQSWTVHGHVVYSFDDLNSKFCESGTVEEHETLGWAKTENPATKRVFVELLNLTLRDQLRDQDLLFYEPDRYFYERPDPRLDTKRTRYSSRSSPISFTVLLHRRVGDRNRGGNELEIAWKVDVIVAVATTNCVGLHTCSPRSERDIRTDVERNHVTAGPAQDTPINRLAVT